MIGELNVVINHMQTCFNMVCIIHWRFYRASLSRFYRGCICIVAQNEMRVASSFMFTCGGAAAATVWGAALWGSSVVVGKNTVILELDEFIRGTFTLLSYFLHTIEVQLNIEPNSMKSDWGCGCACVCDCGCVCGCCCIVLRSIK